MKEKSKYQTYFGQFFNSFLRGLVIIAPIGATLYIVFWIFNTLDNMLPFQHFLPENWNRRGLGFITVIIFITAVGYFFNKFLLGQILFEGFDRLLEKTPGLKHIYTPTKEVMNSFMGDKKKFDKPVWVKTNENPEIWRIGFLTQTEMSIVGKTHYVSVYLPHSYAISGWVVITKKENIKPVKGMNATTAMKFAVSGGVAGFHSDDNVFKAPE